MANRWPHLLQTTVSIRIAVEGASASARRRLANPFDFTSAAFDVDGNCARRLGRPRGLRSAGFVACFVNRERPTVQILAVQSRHRFFRFIVVGHRNKAEAAGSSVLAIGRNVTSWMPPYQ